MNEVTRVHLGRQPFTISVEAHEALKAYLADIKKQVGSRSADVVEEVELRMAELLTEQGVGGDKVVLLKDVVFLKEQLGAPKDFKEDDDGDEPVAESEEQPVKRLFRDTENGMIAGVAAGLANYFGIEVLIVRLLFVVAVLSGGWGIVLYVLLWLLVPEAKTSSERLQMQGVAVTVDNLKELVERADVEGAAERANKTIMPVFNTFFDIILKIVGASFILTGLSMMFGIVFTKTYMLAHDGNLFQERLFPVGSSEQLLANLGLAMIGLIALFIVFAGTALFRKKWPLKGWATGVLVTIFIAGLAAGSALAADVAPRVHDRFQNSTHRTIRNMEPFTRVDIEGDGFVLNYHDADEYSVKLSYFGDPDLSELKTTVTDGTLTIDSRQFDDSKDCTMFCLFPQHNMIVTVYAPASVEKEYVDYEPDWQTRFDYQNPVPIDWE